jgi:hypothetical protein
MIMTKAIKFIIFAAIAVIAGAATSCTDYQDEIDALKNRVDTLYTLQNNVQNNLNTLETLIVAMEDHWYVVGWAALPDDNGDGVSDGYVINLRKDKYDKNTGEVIEAEKEEKTITVKNGTNGSDAQFPDISARENENGGWWFWVIKNPTTGEWEPITDENGDTIKVAQDAVSPKLEIKWDATFTNPDGTKGAYVWFTSIDNGQTWQSTGIAAVGEKGDTGSIGPKGPDGENAQSPVTEVNLVIGDDSKFYLKLVLLNGSVVTLPVSSFVAPK